LHEGWIIFGLVILLLFLGFIAKNGNIASLQTPPMAPAPQQQYQPPQQSAPPADQYGQPLVQQPARRQLSPDQQEDRQRADEFWENHKNSKP
jgi:hypothetical protein